MKAIYQKLISRVDSSSLVAFRISFGVILVWEVVRYFQKGWINRYFIEPDFNFKYTGFGWLEPLPAAGMYGLFVVLGLAATLFALGLFYRVAAVTIFLGVSYFFLLEETRYLNHIYLVILLAFLCCFLPLNRSFSLDAIRNKNLSSKTLPFWVLALLQFQIGVPYFWGGVAKLQSDWFQGEPMRIWLRNRTDFPVIGSLFTQEWLVYLFSYSGLFLDLLAVPLLLWRKSRPIIFPLLVTFHLFNSRWFGIGIFPWFMILATTLFFKPDWPREVYESARQHVSLRVLYTVFGLGFAALALWMLEDFSIVVSAVGFVAGVMIVYGFWDSYFFPAQSEMLPPSSIKRKKRRVKPQTNPVLIFSLSLWLIIHTLLPLRHLVIPGNPNWTEEGHRFAWHMLLRVKGSDVEYIIEDRSQNFREVHDPEKSLEPFQFNRFKNAPHLIHEYARHLAEDYRAQGYENVSIRARSLVALNGRKGQPMIDASVDLANEPEALWRADWILPLREPLK